MKKKILFSVATTAFVNLNAQNEMVEGHEAVDLGLSSGLLWATTNVGATKPEEYGKFFAWGETKGYAEGEQHTFNWANYFDSTDGDDNAFTTYNINGGETELKPEHDAATKHWGKNWRMPSKADFDELLKECDSEWTTQNGVNGRKFTSKKNNNSIFLPAAGYRWSEKLYAAGSEGNYWSRSLKDYDSSSACSLYWGSANVKANSFSRYFGFSVRAVCEKTSQTSLESTKAENKENVTKTIENGQIVIIKNGEKYNLAGQKL